MNELILRESKVTARECMDCEVTHLEHLGDRMRRRNSPGSECSKRSIQHYMMVRSEPRCQWI